MKLKLRITDSAEHLPDVYLFEYWINHDDDLFPHSLGEQKQIMRRLIRKHCKDDEKVLEVTSVFPAALEVVSECIKERIIRPRDVELSVFREEDSKGDYVDTYSFTEDGDLAGDYKLNDLIHWLLY